MAEAHEAIRNLLGRYCELIDAGDWDGLADLLSDAALCDDDGNEVARGRDGVHRFYAGTQRYGGTPRTRHLTTNSIIEVDNEAGTATARSAFVVFQATDALALQPIVAGRYRDGFTRGNGGVWSFASRCFAVDLIGDVSKHLSFDLEDPA